MTFCVGVRHSRGGEVKGPPRGCNFVWGYAIVEGGVNLLAGNVTLAGSKAEFS